MKDLHNLHQTSFSHYIADLPTSFITGDLYTVIHAYLDGFTF